jgi:hypothetical protein
MCMGFVYNLMGIAFDRLYFSSLFSSLGFLVGVCLSSFTWPMAFCTRCCMSNKMLLTPSSVVTFSIIYACVN